MEKLPQKIDRIAALTTQISEWNQRVVGLEERLAEETERRDRAEHRYWPSVTSRLRVSLPKSVRIFDALFKVFATGTWAGAAAVLAIVLKLAFDTPTRTTVSPLVLPLSLATVILFLLGVVLWLCSAVILNEGDLTWEWEDQHDK
jgi:anti-sigma-K factor RskA